MSCVLCNCNLRGIECTLSWILCGHQCENKDEPACQRCADHFTVALVSIFIKRGREEWEKKMHLIHYFWINDHRMVSYGLELNFNSQSLLDFFFFYAYISVFILLVSQILGLIKWNPVCKCFIFSIENSRKYNEIQCSAGGFCML